MRKFYLICTINFLIIAFTQAQVINLNSNNAFSTKKTSIPKEFLHEGKAARIFEINPLLQDAKGVKIGDKIALQLFENQNYTAQVSAITNDVNGNFTITLKILDYQMAYGMITTSKEGKSLFTLTIPELNCIFKSNSSIYSDRSYLFEMDKSQLLQYENDAIPVPEKIIENIIEETPEENGINRIQRAPTLCAPDQDLTSSDPAQIDILIVYTPAAKAWANSNDGGIANTIAGAMVQTQAVLNNQGNGDLMTCVYSAEIEYTENPNISMNTDLDLLTGTEDGYMDNVHQLRKQYNADIVVLIVVNDVNGGLGWVLSNSTNGSYDHAFNVIRVQQSSWTTTSIHEIGHNMGMLHNTEDNSISPPLFPYAYGWHWIGNNSTEYGSVMSYIGNETPYFSNPNENYMGAPTGTATANNAQVFRNTKHIIAFYSDRLANIPDAPTNIVVSNPIENGATFSWNAVVNATEYKVCNSAGSCYSTTNTTFTVNYATWFPAACTNYDIYIRAVNQCGEESSGTKQTFKTKCATDPTVTTQAATNITTTTATLNKIVTDNGTPVTGEGFMYKKTSESVWQTSTTGNLTGLDLNTQYQFYAYATTASYTFNGNTLTFKTLACEISTPTSIVISNPTNNGATVTWNAVPEATTYTLYFLYNSGWWSYPNISTNSFNINNSTYFQSCTQQQIYIRAIGSCGDYAQSQTITFTTKCATDPTVTTQAATGVTSTAATLNKTVTPNGETVTAQGFMYKKTSESVWQTSPTGNLTGLTANTQYQFYAYATTATNTFNGSVLTFTTLAHTKPTVITEAATDVLQTTATLNKTVTAGTEGTPTQGFMYKETSEIAWIENQTGSLTGLTADTEYEFYAYATTATYTVTGNTLTFKTKCYSYNHLVNVSVCTGADYTCPDGTVYTDITEPISHTNNLLSVVTLCDSIVELEIDVLPTSTTEKYDTIYNNETYKGQTYAAGDHVLYDSLIEENECILVKIHLNVKQNTALGFDFATANNIILYPNPAKNILYIDSETKILNATIFAVSGQNLIFSDKNSVDISTLIQGIYFIKIELENSHIIYKKFLKK